MIGAEAIEKFRLFLLNLLTPPSQESAVKWCEDNVTVPVGPHQGRLTFNLMPYAREIVDRFGSRATRHLVLCFGSQSSKTMILTLGMLYRISRDPKDTLWVSGNKDMATAFNKERFIPHAEACPPVAALIPKTAKGITDRRRFGFSSQHYLNMVLNFVGSNSPTNLSSRPVGCLILDETDKYAQQSKFEAGALQLAEERNKAYSFPFIAKASTPTLERGIIWPEFLLTDQRYYNVPCPRCSREIIFKFKIKTEEHGDCGLRWWHDDPSESKIDGQWDMELVAANSFYKCQLCGKDIQNHERGMMLENGIWRATNPRAEKGRFGYHISSLYSVLSDETSFPSIAVKWLLCNTMSAKQNFINSWLAELWDESKGYEQREIITEVYSSQDVPEDGSTPIMAVDVQQNLSHFWVVIRRFMPPSDDRPNGESWLLFADRVDTEEQLKQLQKEYRVAGENVLCDMAHRPNQAARMIIENDWRGIWGSPTAKNYVHKVGDLRVNRPYSEVKLRDPHLGTSWENRFSPKARFVYFVKSAISDMVASLRHKKPAIWHVTANCSVEYSIHLNSRQKIQRQNKNTGVWEAVWMETSQKNHLLDAEGHVTVRALQLGLISIPDEMAQSFDQ